MALTLAQYADYLDGRGVTWPAVPEPDLPRAKPHLPRLTGVRAVLWNVYGTLLAIAPEGELLFEHPQSIAQQIALEKTVNEFKLWNSMYRQPGQPSDSLGQMYERALAEERMRGRERHAELLADRLWESLLKKLLPKGLTVDTGFYGSLDEFSRKVAYFFHASLQGCGAYPGAAEALRAVHEAALVQGICADGQCFTETQLRRAIRQHDPDIMGEALADPTLWVLSYQTKVRKPADGLFRSALTALSARGFAPAQVLHVGSSLTRDLAPAKRLGLRTALFAGDRAALRATPELLKDAAHRPDVLLTELTQIAQVVGF